MVRQRLMRWAATHHAPPDCVCGACDDRVHPTCAHIILDDFALWSLATPSPTTGSIMLTRRTSGRRLLRPVCKRLALLTGRRLNDDW